MKMKPPSGPKKQTQTNPIFSKAKMNLELIRKSRHTLAQFHNRIGQYYTIRVKHYFLAGLWMQTD